MEKIAAVVVTYNRPHILKKCLESMLAQTVVPERIYVIDNSPGTDTRSMIETYFSFVKYEHFPDNIGSEGGYCEGIKLAYEDSDYVWLLDDDCVSEKNALAELLKWAIMLGKEGKVGAVRSARSWDSEKDSPILEIEDLFAWRGTLVSSEVVKKTGLPEKTLFLYGGDMEYGLRIRKAGYRMYLIFSSRIDSLDFSGKIQGKIGTVRTESYTQPFRIYYAYRNELWVHIKYREYFKALKLFLHGVKNFCFHITGGKIKRAIAILDGITDGAKKKLGKRRKYLPS